MRRPRGMHCTGLYERAPDLLDAEDPEPVLEVVTIWSGSGLRPAGARGWLLSVGAVRAFRRPAECALANPGGLTQRQPDVLT